MVMPSLISTSTSTGFPQDGTHPRPHPSWITECGGTAPCPRGTGTRRAPCRLFRALAQTARTRIRWATYATTGWTMTRTGWSTPSTTTATVMPIAAATTMTATAPLMRTRTAGIPTATACPTDGRSPTTSTRPLTPTWTVPTVIQMATASAISGSTSTRLGGLATAPPTHRPSISGPARST